MKKGGSKKPSEPRVSIIFAGGTKEKPRVDAVTASSVMCFYADSKSTNNKDLPDEVVLSASLYADVDRQDVVHLLAGVFGYLRSLPKKGKAYAEEMLIAMIMLHYSRETKLKPEDSTDFLTDNKEW